MKSNKSNGPSSLRKALLLVAVTPLTLLLGSANAWAANPPCEAEAKAAPAGYTDVLEGTTIGLNGQPSKPNSATFLWSQLSGPTGAFSSTTIAKPDFTVPQVGPLGATAVLRLTVTGCSPALSNSVDIIVTIVDSAPVNYAPVASAVTSPNPAQEGNLVSLDGSGSSDPDGDALTYNWTQTGGSPVVALTNSSSAVATFTAPNTAFPGGASLTFRLTVFDGAQSAFTDKIVNIVWVDDPPTASLDCPTSADEGAELVLDGSASSDSDDGINTYYWNQVVGPPSIDMSAFTGDTASLSAPHLGLGQLGFVPFKLTVTDFAGQSSSDECTVQIMDVTAPVITNATDLVKEATSPSGATASYDITAYDNVDGDSLAVCSPVSGSTFPLGETTVNCSKTDSASNTGSASFTVTVVDTTAPVIDSHGDVEAEATSPDGAIVAYVSPATSDAYDGPGTATCTPASGSQFALGSTTVTCEATDANDNVATATTFDVIVADTTAPIITPPGNVSAEATGPFTVVDPGSASATDAVGPITYEDNAPASYPVGVTTITWKAIDGAGNTATATSKVTITDITPPIVDDNTDQTIEATSSAGAVAIFDNPAAYDLVDLDLASTCSHASGATFPIDTTTVTCSATDAAGNTGYSSFTIKVQDTTAPTIAFHADVNALATSAAGANVSYIDPTASDLVTSPVVVNCSPDSGLFPVGTTQIDCSATDAAGNTATSHFNVIVSYNFNGFFRPIDNLPIVNVVKAGQGIPVKFSLGGNMGLGIMFPSYPASVPMTCAGTASDDVEETVTAGGSSLSYDPTTGQYTYVWKTEKSWAASCRQLRVKLIDGTSHIANFNFTR